MEKKDIVDKIFDTLCGLTEYHHAAGGGKSPMYCVKKDAIISD